VSFLEQNFGLDVPDDVETDVESCGLGWMLSTLLSLVLWSSQLNVL
jgi:hypothetical protein